MADIRQPPRLRYAERIINLLLHIELNKFDNRHAFEGRKTIYIVDADIVGFYIRPAGYQARYANLGFMEQGSQEELEQAILTADYIFGGALPGQAQGEPAFVVSPHALEIAEMREAIRRNPKFETNREIDLRGKDNRAKIGPLHDHPVSEFHLLTQLTSGRIAPAERLQVTRQINEDVDPGLRIHWHDAVLAADIELARKEAAYPSSARSRGGDDRFGAGRRSRTLRRDASALAIVTTLRQRLLEQDPSLNVVFISGSQLVHAAFGALSVESPSFDIADYWLRHPIQYTPYLNLSSREAIPEGSDPRFVFETLETVCRDALVDWPGRITEFSDLLTAQNMIYGLGSFGNPFNQLREQWIARLPRSIVEKKYSALRDHWNEVAEAAADVLSDRLAERVSLLERKIELELVPDGIAKSRKAAHELRMASLKFDAFRDLARSIVYYRGVRADGLSRPIHAPVRERGTNAIHRDIISVLHAEVGDQSRRIVKLFNILDSKNPSILLQSAALMALRAHQWGSARRWARELADGNPRAALGEWGADLPEPSHAEATELENAWFIRSVAGRYSAFDTDPYDELLVSADKLIEFYAAKADSVGLLIARAERLALQLFAMAQGQFASPEDRGAVLGAPRPTAETLEALLEEMAVAVNAGCALSDAHPDDDAPVAEVLVQLSCNASLFAAMLGVAQAGAEQNGLDRHRPLLDWAHAQLAAAHERNVPPRPTVHTVALALNDIVFGRGGTGGRTTVRHWARQVQQRSGPEVVRFDLYLRRALDHYGFS